MNHHYSTAIREFIDFVNLQVGVYMDSIAAFEGHKVRTERQVARINRPARTERDAEGRKVIVWASYEDPSQPDIIHNRVIRADEYMRANSEGGVNYQQLCRAILIFIFTFWEDETRRNLAEAMSKTASEIKSDIMGDLRLLRHAILHHKGWFDTKEHAKLKKLGGMFKPEEEVVISHTNMHQIFILIKQSIASLTFDAIEGSNPPFSVNELRDVAISTHAKKSM